MESRSHRVQVDLDEDTYRRFKIWCASAKPRLSMRVTAAMLIGQLITNAHRLTNSMDYSANEQMTLAFDDFSNNLPTIQKQRGFCRDSYRHFAKERT